ncbi:prion-like-(Q/N-rich) domain-bearing protein 25 isoform X2 [Anopheles aquasalis]|uniref:prion-like-(Q/N-rich) domain-bearing protein 25 isoform X2 n=1 Tax=Anopheles aquasalis TaxID=42839 RepID=UPI00215A5C53|nr:prion-like-(Q/N-rich) domain-bearing protein 25 isoform X2 [Anopheles aquasalis]
MWRRVEKREPWHRGCRGSNVAGGRVARWCVGCGCALFLLLLVTLVSQPVQCQTFIRPATDIGDYCLHNDQCQYTLSTDSECRDNSCQCREGAHYVEREKRCYKTSFLGDYCRLTNNCIGNGTYCRDGVCVCTPGKHPNNDRNRCLQDAKLGDPCFRDEECVTDNSRCAQEVCTCRISHVLNEHRNRCLPIASKMYDLCEEHIQCLYNIPYSQCRITTGTDGITSGRCSCANRFHETNLKCYSSVHLNGICEVNENCIDIDTACIHGRCRCIDHLIEVNGVCSGTVSMIHRSSVILILTLVILATSYSIS